MEINKTLDEKLSQGREYRRTQNIEIRADEGGRKVVRGYATTFNEPYLLYDWGNYKVFEQVDRRAFDEADMSDVIMQYDHEGRVFARISNNTLSLNADSHGLQIEADLGGTTLGSQVYEEIKGGYTNKMSFGFRVAEDTREITEDRENNVTTVLRTITKISKLYDVSAVSLPANDGTEISARNFSEGVIEEIKQELLEAENKRKAREDAIKRIKLLAEV